VSSFYVPTESLLESRTFRRLLVFSLVGHILVFLALTLRPFGRAKLISPSPVMVELVGPPKAAAPPKPAPKPPAAKPLPKPPEPAPAPPPKPMVKEIVVPKEPQPLAKPKPEPVVEKKAPPPTPEELMAKISEKVEAQEAAAAAQKPPAEEAPPSAVQGGPGEFDPLFSPWIANVQVRVRANWSGASMCTGEPKFNVDVGADGRLSNIELAESSGDKSCDASGERALLKSNPLPPPPHAISLTLNLVPKDNE
jgi:colicin import membrane protein